MKRWPLGFLLVLALSAHAESFWDGNAAVQRGDAAFEAGMFAVSSAFARGTEIVIEDLASGKTTTARVTGRVADRLDILVLLSPAAALPLGLELGDIAYVRVTVRRVAAESTPILSEDTAPSPDPDRVPPAVLREATVAETGEATTVAEPVKTTTAPAKQPEAEALAPTETPAAEVAEVEAVEAPAEEPEAEAVAPAEVTAAEAESTEVPAEEAVAEVEAAEAVAPVEEPVTSAEDAAFLAGLAARSPQKQLFLPPREDEMFAYQEPVEPTAEQVAEAAEVVAQPAETATTAVEATAAAAPEIASDTGPSEPGDTSESIALAEAQPPAEIRPELVETLAAKAPETVAEPERSFAEPATVLMEAVVAPAAGSGAEPQAAKPAAAAVAAATVAKPAEAPAAAAAAKPAEVKPAAVQTVLDLPAKGTLTWYLQLAAYTNETLARDTAARLSSTYPVLVLAPQAGAKPLYRVFVGPLNRAESGTLLNYFHYRGFPDAFVRTAQK